MGGTAGGPRNLSASNDVPSKQDNTPLAPSPHHAVSPPSFLSGAVGPGRDNKPEDVWLASSLMAENGFLPAPTTIPTPEFLDGIGAVQDAVGETRDHWAGKGGSTERAVVNAVEQGTLKGPPRPTLPEQAEEEIFPSGHGLGGLVQLSSEQPSAAPPSFRLPPPEARPQNLLSGETAPTSRHPVKRAHLSGPSPLSGQAVQELDRLARGMAKVTKPGGAATDIIQALEHGGAGAKQETRYLLSQLDQLAPVQGASLRAELAEAFKRSPATLDGAFPEHRQSFEPMADRSGERRSPANKHKFHPLVNPTSTADGGIIGDLPPELVPALDPASQGDINRAYGRSRDATLILPDPKARGISAETDDMIDTLAENGVVVTTTEIKGRPPINSRIVDPYKAGQVLGRIASGDIEIPAPSVDGNRRLTQGLVLHIGGAQVDQRTAYLMAQASSVTPETLKTFQRSISEKNAPYLGHRQRAQLNLWAQNIAKGKGLRDLDLPRILSDNDAPGVRQRKIAEALASGSGGKNVR